VPHLSRGTSQHQFLLNRTLLTEHAHQEGDEAGVHERRRRQVDDEVVPMIERSETPAQKTIDLEDRWLRGGVSGTRESQADPVRN